MIDLTWPMLTVTTVWVSGWSFIFWDIIILVEARSFFLGNSVLLVITSIGVSSAGVTDDVDSGSIVQYHNL